MSEPVPVGRLIQGFAARLIAETAERAPFDPARIGIPRQRLHPLLRSSVLRRDNFTCQWCFASGRRDRSLLLEIDHIVPWSAGGADHPMNLRTLCQDCNQMRSNRVSEFDRRALPIVWRCYTCDSWGDVEWVELFTAFCSTCGCTRQDAPHVADLMIGGPAPTVGIPDLQPGDQDVSAIPLTVRAPARRFRDWRERDDRRRAARAELDRIRPRTEEQA